MLPTGMPRPSRLLALLAVPVTAGVLVACGSEDVDLPADANAQIKQGATIFVERCSGCHTLSVAGTEGSATNVHQREYKDGPNFDQRKEQYDQILYAIRNGGYSSGPMPQNLVTGAEAEAVARFIEKYSGSAAKEPPTPKQTPAGGGREQQPGLDTGNEAD
jgi:mono/diheme cytochrome c family protein